MRYSYFTFCFLFISTYLNAQFYGPEDFRISDAGGLGSTAATTDFPDLTYNSSTQQYLVVWEADDTDQAGVVDNNTQIIGRFVDLNGNVIGDDFLISSLNLGDDRLENQQPRAAYNSTSNNFMVVYQGESILNQEDIYATIIDQNGAIVSADIRISTVGNPTTDARSPAIAYNPELNEYLVAYVRIDQGTDSSSSSVEIVGQRLDASGSAIGASFDITDSTGSGVQTNSSFVDVIFNEETNDYVITYQASPRPNEEDAFSTLVNQTGMVGITTQLSNRGSIDSGGFSFIWVRAAYSPVDDRYLFVYEANNTRIGEFDVFGVIYDRDMNLVIPEFEISQVAGNSTQYDAVRPNVAWRPSDNTFYVVFQANPFFNNRFEREIFMRSVTTAGTVGNNLMRVSSAPVDESGIAFSPRIASNENGALLTVYRAGDTSPEGMMANSEYEIFGQLYGTATLSNSDNRFVDVHIYPNPVEHELFIAADRTDINEVVLFNNLGQLVFEKGIIGPDDFHLDVSNLNSGMYFIKMNTSNGSITRKILKK